MSAMTAAQMDVIPSQRRSQKLPITCEPFADESLPGLIMRVAAMYRFRDPLRIFRRLRPPDVTLWTFSQQDPDSAVGHNVRDVLGLSDEDFRRLTMWTGSETTINVLGVPIWSELVRHSVRVVCTMCLRESSHHRAVWLVDSLPVCARHGVWLRDRCASPTCDRPLAWNGFNMHLCGHRRCRYDLREAPVEEANSDLSGIVALNRLLHTQSNAPLEMPPGEVLRMAFILGQLSRGVERNTRPPSFIRGHLRQMPDIINAGWRALDDWPNGFHRFLDGRRSQISEKAGRAGLRKTFGVLSTRVYDWAREPWGQPIGVAFAEYAATLPDLATSPRRLRRYAPGIDFKRHHVTLPEAQRLLGISPGAMLKMAKRRDMFVSAPRDDGVPLLLRADMVRDLQREADDWLLPEKARSALGVGRKVMDQLEAGKLINRLPEGERMMQSRPFKRSQIDGFIAACVGKAPEMAKVASKASGLIKLSSATVPGRSVVDICRALVDRRLKSAATVAGETGLACIRLSMDDLERVLPVGRQTMSMVEAAATMKGVRYQHVYVWARRGFLKTSKSPRPGEVGLRVTEEDWATFRENFLTGGDLCNLLGQRSSTWPSRHLQFLGVSPVSGPGVDDGMLTLFRREDCTPAVLDKVRGIKHKAPGTPQDKHRQAFARAAQAAACVEGFWNTEFRRTHNTFTERGGGRTLQVVSGRRPDATGVFVFSIAKSSLARLEDRANVWLALVPSDGDTFLLMPAHVAPWRGGASARETGYLTVRFDSLGQPLEMEEWAVQFGPPEIFT